MKLPRYCTCVLRRLFSGSSAVIGNALTNDTGDGVDSDPDGDTLTVTPQTGVTGSNGGTFSIDSSGAITFDPGSDFQDLAVGATRDTTLTYTISDGNGGTDTATVDVTIIAMAARRFGSASGRS